MKAKNRIWAQMLVKNEDRFIWYAVMSIINHVDKILLWDNGSIDQTVPIILEIMEKPKFKSKIRFRKVPYSGKFEEEKIRQQMLDQTESDWFLIIDGDEIWSDRSVLRVKREIDQNGDSIEGIFVPTVNLIGDLYHSQESTAGHYSYYGHTGHLKLCWFNRRIPGLRSKGKGWDWGWVDREGNNVAQRGVDRIVFVDAPYLHATHLRRSSIVKNNKFKFELGDRLSKDFKYPAAFFAQVPELVPSVWEHRSWWYTVRAALETGPKKIKRRLGIR